MMTKKLALFFILLFFISSVFSWDTKSYEATVPLYAGERLLGELKLEINGDDPKELLINLIKTRRQISCDEEKFDKMIETFLSPENL